MHILKEFLMAIRDDCNFKVTFRPLNKDTYEEQWEAMNRTIERVKPPTFFCKGIDLGEITQNMNGAYIEIFIENAGHKQQHEYLLSNIVVNKAESYDRVVLAFTSKFSNWGAKRIVMLDKETKRILRNDFNIVYKVSWDDYNNGQYQSAKKRP